MAFGPPTIPLLTGTAGGPIPLAMGSSYLHVPLAIAGDWGRGSNGVMARAFQDDLIAVNSARQRARGVIKPGAETAIVSFGEGVGALRREVSVVHRVWSHGRGISLFICPKCGGKAQILRLHDGAPQCRKCLMRSGVQFKISLWHAGAAG